MRAEIEQHHHVCELIDFQPVRMNARIRFDVVFLDHRDIACEHSPSEETTQDSALVISFAMRKIPMLLFS